MMKLWKRYDIMVWEILRFERRNVTFRGSLLTGSHEAISLWDNPELGALYQGKSWPLKLR